MATRFSLVIDYSLQELARIGVIWPIVGTGYFFIRLIAFKIAWAPLLLSPLAICAFVCTRNRYKEQLVPANHDADASRARCVLTAALMALLIGGSTIPVVYRYFQLRAAFPHNGYLFSDDAYEVEIARGLTSSLPPPDLGYSGRILHYHVGHALVLEFFSRLLGVPPFASLYLAFPLFCRLIIIACVYRTLSLYVPSLNVTTRLIGTAVALSAFTVEPLNVLWHTYIRLHGANASLFGDLPVAVTSDLDQFSTVYYGHSLVIVLVVGLLANVDRAGILGSTCFLIYVYLAKSQMLLPIGLGWIVMSGLALVRSLPRQFTPLTAGIAALGVVLATKSVLVPVQAHLSFTIGRGFALESLERLSAPFLGKIGCASVAAAVTLALITKLAGTHLFGFSACSCIANSKRGCSSSRWDMIVLVTTWGIFGALAGMFLLPLPSPHILDNFVEIHEGIKERLWLPFADYLPRMMSLSMASCLKLVPLPVALLGGGGVVWYWTVTKGRFARLLFLLLIGLSIGLFVLRVANELSATHDLSATPVPAGADACLRMIPIQGTIILTNDLDFDRVHAPHLPLMNAWLPAQYGHQFWATDFMYNGNFAAEDAKYRLERLDWFWKESFSEGHLAFLSKHRISHLLVNTRIAVDWQCPQGLREVVRNGDFRVAEVLSAPVGLPHADSMERKE